MDIAVKFDTYTRFLKSVFTNGLERAILYTAELDLEELDEDDIDELETEDFN